MHVPPTEAADNDGCQGVDDQVPHGVGQTRGVAEHRLLHVGAEGLVHGEFEDFPKCADGDGEHHRKQGDEAGTHMQVDPLVFVENIDEEKTEQPEQQAGAAMQCQIPPPEPLVVAADLA